MVELPFGSDGVKSRDGVGLEAVNMCINPSSLGEIYWEHGCNYDYDLIQVYYALESVHMCM
jgi:hypothetical protein